MTLDDFIKVLTPYSDVDSNGSDGKTVNHIHVIAKEK